MRPCPLILRRSVGELVETVTLLRELEGGEDGVRDLAGGPAADLRAGMQEDLEQADDARLVNLEAGIADGTDGDRVGEALQERKVDVDVEPLRLVAGEAIGDRLEGGAHGVEMIEPLSEAEVGEVVGSQLVAQEGPELLVLLEEGVLEVGAEDMMAVLDAVDDGGQLAVHAATDAPAEDGRDLVGAEPPQAEFAAALEQLVDGKVALEDEVAAILDLTDGVEARQVELGALLLGELRPEDEGPIVEPRADDLRAQSVSRRLECRHVVDGEEGVVVLAEADPRPLQLLLDVAVGVEIVGGLKGEERRHPHDHRSEHLVADVEVVVGEAAALPRDDAVMRVLARILRQADPEGCTLLHALEDEVDTIAVAPGHAVQPRQDMVFLAHPLLGPHDRELVIARIGFNPAPVIFRPLAQHLLADLRHAEDAMEEVDDQFRPRQRRQIAVNDNPVEAVIDEGEKIAEQPGEDVHRIAPNRRSNPDRATPCATAVSSVSPMRFARSSDARPPMKGASSPPISSSCSRPKPATPGSSIRLTTSPHVSHASATPNLSPST